MPGNIKYQYSPLEHSREFRLVRLKANSNNTTERSITCDFLRHSIDKAPSYSTLSYTWASADLDKEERVVCVNGSVILIQANLAAWINTHGISWANHGHLFWIDQLCIDQSNINERGKQVRLMKDIYAKSSKLFVWLGPGSEDSTLALETMNRAGRVLHEVFRDPLRHQLSPEEYYARGFPKPDTVAWGAVYRLFNNAYFRRVWVQQEVVASDLYEIVLQCGTMQIPWIGLENTAFAMTGVNSVMNAKVYDDMTTSGLQGSQMRLAPPAVSGVAGLQGFRATNPDSVHRTLYNVLKNFRGYQATDPRDMVFALVGMQYDSRDTILGSDYNRTVEELYTSVTFLMIRKYGINILCEAGLPNRALAHLSSWAIDWTFRPAAISNLIVPGRSATATSQPSLGLQQDSKLVLQGLVIDVVDQCTSRPLQADEKHDNVDMALGAGMFAWHHEAAQIAQSLRHDLASGLPEDDAFWRTLVVDRNPLGGPAPQSFKDEYPKVLDYLQLLEHHDYDAMKVATNPNAKELETFSNDLRGYRLHSKDISARPKGNVWA